VATEPTNVDLVLGDEAAGVLHRNGGIGRIVEQDDVELLARDRLRPEVDAVLGRNAECGSRAGQRGADADREVGVRERGGGQAGQRDRKCA